MDKVAIKQDIRCKWEVTTNGHAESLEGRDLKLLIYPIGNIHDCRVMPFTIEGSTIYFDWKAKDQKQLGIYSATLFENYNSHLPQGRFDKIRAIQLVENTELQSFDNSDDSSFQSEVFIDLGIAGMCIGFKGANNYELWLQAGHRGSLEDFLIWSKGEPFRYEDFTEEEKLDIIKPLLDAYKAEKSERDAEFNRNERKRDQKEQERISAENKRVDAEKLRAEAETKRTEDEEARSNAEKEREDNENERVQNERQRKEAEESRNKTLTDKVAEFDSEKSKIDTAITNANAAAKEAQNSAYSAQNATTFAERVNAVMEGDEIVVIDRNGNVTRRNVKGRQGDKGNDGRTPVKGVDYFDGRDGINGKDGVNGKDGKDYVITQSDYNAIADIVSANFIDVELNAE